MGFGAWFCAGARTGGRIPGRWVLFPSFGFTTSIGSRFLKRTRLCAGWEMRCCYVSVYTRLKTKRRRLSVGYCNVLLIPYIRYLYECRLVVYFVRFTLFAKSFVPRHLNSFMPQPEGERRTFVVEWRGALCPGLRGPGTKAGSHLDSIRCK